MSKTLHRFRCAAAAALMFSTLAVHADPLPAGSVPDSLRPWLPWALQNHPSIGCPQASDGGDARVCVWPATLELAVNRDSGTFTLDVEVFGSKAFVQLPGSEETWPQGVRTGNTLLPVVERDGQPWVELPAGRHTLAGGFAWLQKPQEIEVPTNLGAVSVRIDGTETRLAPDKSGRIALREQVADESEASDSIRVSRLIDDDVPLRLTTRIDLALGGKPRELAIAAALPEGFVPEAVNSELGARLAGSQLVLQARPGNWVVEIRARSTQPVPKITLPAAAERDEVWAFSARSQLRLANIEGVPALDPKQLPIAEAWKQFPVYRVRAGETVAIVEKTRGNANPAPDKLALSRDLWLDFAGGDFTARDRISGSISRAWRLETQAGVALGRVASHGIDQPVTRVDAQANPGFEIRDANADVLADSRLGWTREMPASGWNVDFDTLGATLHVPPGWLLLHASGPDRAEGSWVQRWTLWDFFFVLITALAGARLLGWPAGALILAGLALSWHTPGAPHFVWLTILAFRALQSVLPDGRFQRLARAGSWLSLGALALLLIPFAIQQVRLAMYPNLEAPWRTLGNNALGQTDAAPQRPALRRAPAPAAAPAAPEPGVESADQARQEERDPVLADERVRARIEEREARQESLLGSVSKKAYQAPGRLAAAIDQSARRYDQIDPGAKIPTGPAIPSWDWTGYRLVWAGPVAKEQRLSLFMLPPAGHGALRIVTLLLLGLILLRLAGVKLPAWPRRGGTNAAAGAALAVLPGALLAGLLLLPPNAAQAAEPAAPAPAGDGSFFGPPKALLDELLARLSAPADCQPNCADVARLVIGGAGARLTLGLEVHTQADVFLPLPAAEWRLKSVLADGKLATTRRDEAGTLKVFLRRGVHQLIIDTDVGNAGNLSVSLPLPVRTLRNVASGWAVSGLDARGVPANAIGLSREVASPSGEPRLSSRDSFPAFVQVQRTLRLGLKWQVETRVTRISASQAPILARVRLLPGETVLDPVVKVVDGEALVQLGELGSASFTSALKEQPALKLVAGPAEQQVEVWQLDVSPQWHVALAGIAPILNQGPPSSPLWRPWPGESVGLEIRRPVSVDGVTITADRTSLIESPGQHETGVVSETVLRTSQAADHRLLLPDGAKLGSLSIDGQVQIVQPQGNAVTASVPPGTHLVKIEWREPRGMETRFEARHLASPVAGSNNFTTIMVPNDRVVLAAGGDGYGPAILFWGVLAVLLVVSFGLARTGLTPLGFGAWALLGLGLAQSTVEGALIVVGLFFALYARRRFADVLAGWRFNAVQLLLAAWSLVAAGIMMSAIQSGLLGYPDLLVQGNGSSAFELHWYADRTGAEPVRAWVISMPLWFYRGAMLLWALWLAASLLTWVKWGWGCAVEGGYWRKLARRKAAAPTGTVDAAETAPAAADDSAR